MKKTASLNFKDHELVIQLVAEAYKDWNETKNVSAGTKLAKKVTTQWQNTVCKKFKGRFESEFEVGGGLGEKIDLFDKKTGIAYELKVSPNNDHFEFYRDIFKVMATRANQSQKNKPKHFCFVCPEKTAKKYEKGLRKWVLEQSSQLLGISISIEGI